MQPVVTRPNACNICGQSSGLQYCSSCKSVLYCGRDHQKKDWNVHKHVCAMLKQQKHSSSPVLTPSSSSSSFQSGSQDTFSDVMMDTSTSFPSERFMTNIKSPMEQLPCPVRHEVAYSLNDFEEVDDLLVLRECGVPETDEYDSRMPRNSSQASLQSTSSSRSIPVVREIIDERLGKISEKVSNDLKQHGVCVIDNFLGASMGTDVLRESVNLHRTGKLQPGQVVIKSHTDTEKIRGDQIVWIEGIEDNCAAINYLISSMDKVVMGCGVGLAPYRVNGRTKAMVACYPGGGTGYVRHVDNPNADGRCITCIYYLNQNWDCKTKGGLLRIYPEGKNFTADIEPIFDRLLFFWSDRRNPHEVQPAYDVRYAITVWYFDAIERARAKERNPSAGQRKRSIPLVTTTMN